MPVKMAIVSIRLRLIQEQRINKLLFFNALSYYSNAKTERLYLNTKIDNLCARCRLRLILTILLSVCCLFSISGRTQRMLHEKTFAGINCGGSLFRGRYEEFGISLPFVILHNANGIQATNSWILWLETTFFNA